MSWGVCRHCGTRWPVGIDVLISTDDEDAIEQSVLELSQLIQLTEDETTMNTTQQHEPGAHDYDVSLDFDPWPQPSIEAKAREISGEPSYWHRLNPPPRARLWGCTVAIKQQPPSRSKNVQERVRELLVRQRDQGDVVAMQLLANLQDLAVRTVDPVGDLAKRIDHVGGAIAFLTHQQARLAEQIVRLQVIAGHRAPTEVRR